MALERVPADIRVDGGVARMSDPEMIEGIKEAVTIPVMAKARIGHFVEAQILEALGVDYVDESEVLTPADEAHHIDKWAFTVPFVCGATNLGEALRRISEGACMIRSKGEAGTGNIVEAVRHLRSILGDIRKLTQADSAELFEWAKRLQAPLPLVQEVAETGELPVPLFCAGGIATPADAALVMQLGAEAVFVGLGHLQVRRPRPAGQGHRRGHHQLQRRRTSWPRSAVASARPCPASRWTTWTSSSPIAAGEGPGGPGAGRPMKVGVLALQGAFAAARAGPEPARRRRTSEVRRPGTSADVDASGRCPVASRPPCRCCSSAPGCCEPLGERLRRGPAGVRHLRRR